MADNALMLARPRAAALSADVRDLVVDWKASLVLDVRAGDKTETTRRTYEIGLSKFLAWCAERRTVNDETVREWIAELREAGYKPASVNAWLAGVRSLFAWAFEKHRIPYNPVNGIASARRTGTSRKHARDALTDREAVRLLEQPDRETPEGKRDLAILALMLFTASRTVELHRADLADLQTKGNRLVLNVRGKGHEEADELVVIADPDAEGMLRDWLAVRGDAPGALFVSLSRRSKGGRLSLRAFRGIVKGYMESAGAHGRKSTHSLRHTAITNAVRHGAPVQKVREMARHASIDTTLIYYHETDRVENPAEQFIHYGEV